VADKALTGKLQSRLRTLNAFLDDKSVKAVPERIAKLSELKAKLIKELDDLCNDLIQFIDSKLVPATASAKVFYEKLKADYYRYGLEFKTNACKAFTEKTNASYESGMQIARVELTKDDPAYLELALNYSVFLYEIIGQKQEAIDLADKTFKETVAVLDDVEDGQDSDITLILQLLKDNVELWNRPLANKHIRFTHTKTEKVMSPYRLILRSTNGCSTEERCQIDGWSLTGSFRPTS
jgi:14-3-3 protein epsilon